jgi:putative transcriptional regulator
MSEENITTVELHPDGKVYKVLPDGTLELLESDTDWERFDALTEEEVTAAALSDPDNPPLTDEELAEMRPVPIPPKIREELGMTPLEFAEAFDLPLDAVLTWEAYGTVIDLTAIAYLRVIEQDPEAVRAALTKSRQKTG